MLSEVGLEDEKTLRFCAGCHDPILVAADELNPLDVSSWQANSGITCLSCHRMVDIGEKNGDHRIAEPILHPFALAEKESLQKAHELLLELTPWLHRTVMTKDDYKTSEYCSSCHTLDVPAEINGHADIKMLDEYEAWSKSAYGPEHARYSAETSSGTDNHDSQEKHHDSLNEQQNCQSCHMPLFKSNDPAAKNGMSRSHSFAAGNTTLPLFNQDLEHLEQAQSFLSDDIIELEFIGIKEGQDLRSIAQNGGTLELLFSALNKAVGHNFPAGTADSNEAWISIVGLDMEGEMIASQGFVKPGEQVPDNAFRFGKTYVDINGKVTDRRTTTTSAVALKDSNVIAPKEKKPFSLRLTLPPTDNNILYFTAKLNWRKYDPEFIRWVFDGRRTQVQPITTIAEVNFSVPVDPSLTPFTVDNTLGRNSTPTPDKIAHTSQPVNTFTETQQ